MNTKDLIEELQKMPPDAIVFLSDDNIEILEIRYDFGKVQILIDDRCPNCDELETQLNNKDEYIEELRESQINLKDEIKELEKQLNQIRDILD